MIKLICGLGLIFLAISGKAQESRLFDYNRTAVAEMEQRITPETSESIPIESLLFSRADTVSNPKKFFWTGALGGCLGSLVGASGGYVFGELMELGAGAGYISMGIGLLGGFVIPQVIVARKSGTGKGHFNAALGTLASVCLEISLFVGLEVLTTGL